MASHDRQMTRHVTDMTGYDRQRAAEHIAVHYPVTLTEAYRLLELAQDDEIRVQRALERAARQRREHQRPRWITRLWRALMRLTHGRR